MRESRRFRCEMLRSQLENERSSFLSHWRTLGDYILPRRPRFFTSDANKGDRRSQNIIDITATLSLRTLQSGMMTGITSPARPWFRLTTADQDMSESGPVKMWLDDVTRRMSTVFLKSNLYNMLPITYGDMGCFGVASMGVFEDFENTIHCYSFPIGSYYLINDEKLRVKGFMREYRMTVRQLVNEFGRKGNGEIDWSVFSTHVKNLWDQHQLEAWVDVVHVIQANADFDDKKLSSKFKKYQSLHYELGVSNQSTASYLTPTSEDKFLRESGYDYFPVLAPRWETTGEDVYGTNCPGMTALGDVKQLQLMEKRGAQALEKSINPPIVAPVSMRNQKSTILPGDVTYADLREGMQGMRPIHEVRPDLVALEAKEQQIRLRISRAFYEDLFLMLAQTDRKQITAREIQERHEEKLLALGPVLERVNQDLLDPLIDITFDIMVRQGKIPPAPPQLQGKPLKVEYLSIMAQAQKLIGVSGVEGFTAFVGGIAQAVQDPAILDKVNVDQIIDVYADMRSVPPGIVRSDEEVAQIREQRVKAQQVQNKLMAIREGAAAAKDLSQSDMESDNALTRLTQGGEAGL